jgi:hypothetical protein
VCALQDLAAEEVAEPGQHLSNVTMQRRSPPPPPQPHTPEHRTLDDVISTRSALTCR